MTGDARSALVEYRKRLETPGEAGERNSPHVG